MKRLILSTIAFMFAITANIYSAGKDGGGGF